MRAVVATEPGGPDVLAVVERPEPHPGRADLLVRVHATALNHADLLQRRGRYAPPEGAPDVLGLELAGAVAEVGEQVSGWSVGDRVCAVVAGGGHAEYAVVPAVCALPVPASLAWEEAAAIPEVFSTAWDNVFTRGRLAPDETLLIHGGSSGVGTAAIQLAVRAGATVGVTASTAVKLAACRDLGATHLIDYTEQDFVEEIRAATDGRGADVVLDVVGAAYLERNLSALAVEGRLVVIGLQQGARATLDLSELLTRRLAVMGSTLRARSVAEKAQVAQAVRAHVLPGFDDGSLRPVIDRVLDLDDVVRAHHALEAGNHVGKIVLRVP